MTADSIATVYAFVFSFSSFAQLLLLYVQSRTVAAQMSRQRVKTKNSSDWIDKAL
ncbi:MAG: hypothetical protein OFPI_03700 [Osedax symbiont Rs2]|nr:MAG: hypothetical protein OFPI_03700 [Osedax symbiont Rs2]